MVKKSRSAGHAGKMIQKLVKEGSVVFTPLNLKNGYVGIGVDPTTQGYTYALQLDVDAVDNGGTAIAAAWVAYSSAKHKEDIEQIEDAMDKVLQLRGVNFTWIKSKKEDVGLIAEEVVEVIPRAVEFDENDGTTPIGLDYTRLVPYLIECVKEQQSRILELENKVSEINKKNKDR